MKLPYEIWDVFTDKPLQGNPLALIPNASPLNDAQMQAIAKEFNLSETSFILPSNSAAFRARYFTTTQELPMAGHPTIGTIYALHRDGKIAGDKVKLELKAGIFHIELEHKANKLERAWMAQGVPRNIGHEPNRELVAKAIGLDTSDLMDLPIQTVSVGNSFVIIPVKSLGGLAWARLTPGSIKPTEAHQIGVLVFTTDSFDSKVQCRMFAEATSNVTEDPATGSAHGPLGWYMATHGMLEFQNDVSHFISHQGVEIGRSSELHVRVTKIDNDFSVSVGGHAVLVGEGTLHL